MAKDTEKSKAKPKVKKLSKEQLKKLSGGKASAGCWCNGTTWYRSPPASSGAKPKGSSK